MKKKCALVLADTGPLITLAYADRLDLLLKLDIPIYIIDQVYYEATHNKKLLDVKKIDQFITKNIDTISIPKTFIGELAAKSRVENPNIKEPENLGELAIQEFANDEMIDIIGKDTPALLLFEDNDNKTLHVNNNRIHLLTTKKFIFTLEKIGVIDSAMNLWKEIKDKGRTPSEVMTDKPVKNKKYKSSWEPF